MNRKARGYSLVELLVVLTVMGTIWMTLVLTLHSLYRADRRLHDALTEADSLDRLTMRLRLDAHAAAAAEIASAEVAGNAVDAGRLTLVQTAGRSVAYQIGDRSIHRHVREGDTITHRDTFQLPGLARASWRAAAPPEQRVTLRLQLESGRRGSLLAQQITAALQVVSPANRPTEEDDS